MNVVTIVILNYNGRAWLEKFLPGVVEHSAHIADVLVADNASVDDSADWVSQHCPEVRWLQFDKNHGFAEGNNRAIRHVETPYFLLLNSDVEVTAGWLEPLVLALDSDPGVAAVQPKIRAWHDKAFFEHAGASGGYIDSLGYPFCRGRLFDTVEEDRGQYDERTEIFWASGACMIIRKSVVDEIGLFEGSFFAHMEEIDFCWRALNFGHKILVEPASLVYHVGGGTLSKTNPFKTYLNVRNSLSMMLRNLPRRSAISKIAARLCLDGVWGLKSLLRGDFQTVIAILRAHMHFYRAIPTRLADRRKIYSRPVHQMPDTGVYHGSVVWQHFAKKIKSWSALPW